MVYFGVPIIGGRYILDMNQGEKRVISEIKSVIKRLRKWDNGTLASGIYKYLKNKEYINESNIHNDDNDKQRRS